MNQPATAAEATRADDRTSAYRMNAVRRERAWEAFRTLVAELGGTVLEEQWLGSGTPHRVLCSAGHEVRPTPANAARKRGGLCRVCSGRDSQAAWEGFRSRLAGLGATLLESEWLGSGTPHRVLCAAGHHSSPRPNNLQRRGVFCRACAFGEPAAHWARFRARVAELGGTVLEPEYLGTDVSHRVRCIVGHATTARPGELSRGRGLCRGCAGKDPGLAEAEFRARVKAQGGRLLQAQWLGSGVPHLVRCAAGHECLPRPNAVQQGSALCRKCLGMGWDVFYVVTNDAASRVKFGITNGDGRRRLRVHRKHGYTTVHRLLTGLPDDAAWHMERFTLLVLSLLDMEPVQGIEHFDAAALPVILASMDEHLGRQGISTT